MIYSASACCAAARLLWRRHRPAAARWLRALAARLDPPGLEQAMARHPAGKHAGLDAELERLVRAQLPGVPFGFEPRRVRDIVGYDRAGEPVFGPWRPR